MKTFEQFNQEKQGAVNEDFAVIALTGLISIAAYKFFKKYIPKILQDVSDSMILPKDELNAILNQFDLQASRNIKDSKQLGDVMGAIKLARSLVNQGKITTTGEIEKLIEKMSM